MAFDEMQKMAVVGALAAIAEHVAALLRRRTIKLGRVIDMSTTTLSTGSWWRESTTDQRCAYIAAWLGWTLDAFAFTTFLLIMLPIPQEFGVPLTAVTAVFTVNLWLRPIGAGFVDRQGAIFGGLIPP
jgi:hypothetical protein